MTGQVSAVPGPSPPVLEVKGLSVDFDTRAGRVRAVDGIDFDLAQGETLGLVGESGCGKSQAMLGMLGLSATNARIAGSARLGGEELVGAHEARLNRIRGARIGMIFQDPMTALNPHLRIATQMVEVLRHHRRLRRAAALQRAAEMLDAVHIPEPARCLRRYPHELSGGMRQRATIAMSLLCEPQLLIADEPTTALDVTVQATILELLAEIQRTRGTTIILITHDLGVVAGHCERILVVYAGSVVEVGPASAVFAAPAHPYTAGLIGSVPRVDAALASSLAAIPGQPPEPGAWPVGCRFAPRCAYAFDRCRREVPALRTVGDGHAKACHLDRRPDLPVR